MANRFTEPDEGLEPRPEIEQREGEDDDIFALAEMAISEIRRTTDALATGSITVETWYDQMTDILYAYHLAGWYVGFGEADDPTDGQMEILAEAVAAQIEYLDKFHSDLKAEEEGSQLSNAYRHRAEMYGQAVGQSYYIGQARGWRLPSYPRAGDTDCLVYCRCRWELSFIDEDNGDLDAYWRLGAAEHCRQCPERAKDWKPLKIRNGTWADGDVKAKHFGRVGGG